MKHEEKIREILEKHLKSEKEINITTTSENCIHNCTVEEIGEDYIVANDEYLEDHIIKLSSIESISTDESEEEGEAEEISDSKAALMTIGLCLMVTVIVVAFYFLFFVS